MSEPAPTTLDKTTEPKWKASGAAGALAMVAVWLFNNYAGDGFNKPLPPEAPGIIGLIIGTGYGEVVRAFHRWIETRSKGNADLRMVAQALGKIEKRLDAVERKP